VYDVTSYLSYHPGGQALLLSGGGKDATLLFNSIHSFVNTHMMLKNCVVGTFDPNGE
jgi:cytochrome b involved in lipid metabolism